MNIKGTIKLIGETQAFDSGFTKRQIVVTTQEQYPQDLAIEFVKDKTSILDMFKSGDVVDVAINLRGNEYNGKYYVNLQGWKINKEGSDQAAPQSSTQPIAAPTSTDNDLPF